MAKRKNSIKHKSEESTPDHESSDSPQPRRRVSKPSSRGRSEKPKAASRASLSSSSRKKSRQEGSSSTKEAIRKTMRKKALRVLTRIVSFPYILVQKALKLRNKKKQEKRKEKMLEHDTTSEETGRCVTFSDTVTVHMYAVRGQSKQKITLKKATKSLPPVCLDMANKIKGSSRETPLSRKVLETLEKRVEELEEVRRLLKTSGSLPEKRQKSRIINILGSYTASPEEEERYSEESVHRPEKKPKKQGLKAKKEAGSRPSKKAIEKTYSDDDLSSAATRAYDTMVRKDMSFTPS
ncbi:uncharacterized protein NEMAJ01_1263 [Nematocida major]|uniref:uncharacterized protein n=1 Tax=Nematocida major TaxID=1912982 RepID=UPI002008E938|nr:uncharacterized protein NEMAJ01_1263 [Nematocida major]KAH9386367.1 hypothetical protein NEMAJ01_1263 [Nematocida major]